MRVLVVDDNEPSALTLKWAIENLGDEVRTASNGKEALRQVQDFDPEVILLDIGMPDLTGLQVAEAIRADPLHAGTKIIAQTGWNDANARVQTGQAGFDLHLVKPIDLEQLADILHLLRAKPGAV